MQPLTQALGALDRVAKRAWHDELVRTPETHAWVLNLYRAGEHHPDTVDDYFPWRAAEPDWPELAHDLKRHAADERGHAALYGRLIERMGGRLEELAGPDVFNHAIRAETVVGWRLGPEDPRPLRRLALAHFLAHAHCLERRVAQSLAYHRAACERAGRTEALAVVARVAADEDRHVASTARGLTELTTCSERGRILSFHADAEARADKAFSARQVRTFLARFPEHGGRIERLAFRLGARAMQVAHG